MYEDNSLYWYLQRMISPACNVIVTLRTTPTHMSYDYETEVKMKQLIMVKIVLNSPQYAKSNYYITNSLDTEIPHLLWNKRVTSSPPQIKHTGNK